MNKIKFVSFFLCIITIACAFTGCSARAAASSKDFAEMMTEAGYTVNDISDEADTNNLAKKVIFAIEKDEKYEIQYFELMNSDTGLVAFNNRKEMFEEDQTEKTNVTDVSEGNYSYYSFTTSEKFNVLTRIGKTVILCIAPIEYESEIIDTLKTLGYR